MSAYSPLGRGEADQFDRRAAATADVAGERSDARVDPVNGVLDLWEAQTRLVIDMGAEGQLRRRFERLLPPVTPDPDLFGAKPKPSPGEPVMAAKFENAADFELHLASLSSDLARLAKLKMGGLAHQAIARLRSWIDDEIKAAKARRAAP